MVDPDYVLDLDRPTPGFLCPVGANTYGIDFLSFTIGACSATRGQTGAQAS